MGRGRSGFSAGSPARAAGPQRGSGGKGVTSCPTFHKEITAVRFFVTDRHRPSQTVTAAPGRVCSLLTPEGGSRRKKREQTRLRAGRDSVPQPGGSSKKPVKGRDAARNAPAFRPFLPLHVAVLGRGLQTLDPRPILNSVVFPSFCGRRHVAFTCFSLRGRIRMLLDKNPRAGFLSQHAPAGAARLQADFPGFPARLRRSSEEEKQRACPLWPIKS